MTLRPWRTTFCIAAGEIVLLHGFIKKTRKTPAVEIELARWRRKEIA
ncbi:MAG: type II toxin-antitoxin system RelE/ParE family toxin [Hyphomicrobiales bacterium]